MTEHLRTSAANLRLLADTYEINANAACCEREALAWCAVALRLLDAIDGMEAAADDIEGVWKEAAA